MTPTHLHPLLRANSTQCDGDVRSVQQNLQLGARWVVTGADANGNHPAGTVLSCHTSQET